MEPYRRKVRYWDVDANAHVFNTRYLVYVDDALTDYLDEAGVGFEGEGEGSMYLIVIARTEIDYRSEAVIGDLLATSINLEQVGNTSITFGFEITEEISGRLVARGRETYVTIDPATRRPVTVPDSLRRDLAP